MWCFPALYVIYKRGMLFGTMIGVFTFTCSFLYHSMESLEINQFYLSYSDWHKLDNIGSIMSLIYLFVHLMDNLEYSEGIYISIHETKVDRVYCYLGLFITLLMQTKHPWDIENTVVPIVLFFCLAVGKAIFYRRPRINWQYFRYGCGILTLGIFCFYKGLDDANDYLRIWHGLWHICGSTFMFYFYQSIRKDTGIRGLEIEISPRHEYYSFWNTLVYMYTCGYFPKEFGLHRDI